MPLSGRYEPSTYNWVRDQVDAYERTDGREGGTLDGLPVVILTTIGARSGLLRKAALMRLEAGGVYALIGSVGGLPKHPAWYRNLMADPRCTLRDRAVVQDMIAREALGEERQRWWDSAVAMFAHYGEMQAKTERRFPVMLLERASRLHDSGVFGPPDGPNTPESESG